MQQQIDKMYAASPVSSVLPKDTQRPSVAASFLYKLTEYAAYTSAVASEAYHTLTSSTGLEISIPASKTIRVQDQCVGGDAIQINNDNSEDPNTNNVEFNDNDAVLKNNNTVQNKNSIVQKNNNNIVQKNDNNITQKKNNNNATTSRKINHGVDKKDQCSWTANDNDEEPPPPYDISWTMPTHKNDSIPVLTISTRNLSDTPTLSSSPKKMQFDTLQTVSPIDISSNSSPSTPVKRKQIRVRRPRRLHRRKSSSTDISIHQKETAIHQKESDENEAFLLKVNEKLVDMIARGKAALTSTVYVTDADMMLAEEKEREARIRKEHGLQTPINRRGRRMTCSSDYDYFNGSISDSGNYSAPESSSYCDYGYGSSNGYSTPNEYNEYVSSLRYSSHMHYNTPTQYVSYSSHTEYNLATNNTYNMSNPGKYVDTTQNAYSSKPLNDFSSQIPNRYHSVPAPPHGGYGDMMSAGYSGTMPEYGGLLSNRYGYAQPNTEYNTLPSNRYRDAQPNPDYNGLLSNRYRDSLPNLEYNGLPSNRYRDAQPYQEYNGLPSNRYRDVLPNDEYNGLSSNRYRDTHLNHEYNGLSSGGYRDAHPNHEYNDLSSGRYRDHRVPNRMQNCHPGHLHDFEIRYPSENGLHI